MTNHPRRRRAAPPEPVRGYGTSMHYPYCRDGDCSGCLPPMPSLPEPHPLGHDHPWGHGYCMPGCPTLEEETTRG